MIKLYALTIYDAKCKEEFFIGIYSKKEYALCTAKKYCTTVQGFKDYPCTYSIKEKIVLQKSKQNKTVYLIWGWDIVDGKDTHIWESDLYTDEKAAKTAYVTAQKNIKRQEWALDSIKINASNYTEGFIRITYKNE